MYYDYGVIVGKIRVAAAAINQAEFTPDDSFNR